MSDETIFANARLILADEVVTGSLKVRDGMIAAIEPGAGLPKGAIDCEGHYLSPGLIELHTDNLERHIQPRPHVDWPHDAAILAHDAELAITGITTVFDAMRIGSIPDGKARYVKYARNLASELLALRDQGELRISHFLHLRAEICSRTLIEEIEEFGPEDRVRLVSVMDHTPGQRQFRDISKLKAYYMGKNLMSEADFEDYTQMLEALRAERGDAHEAAAIAFAHACQAVLASHDDTTADHVAASAQHGADLAEFPTTDVAAQACRDNGIAVMMGAPNLIRGESHSGNVSAAELARQDLLDIVSSDYVPSALLLAALRLADLWGDMARAIGTVTAAPAAVTGLTDRGVLEPGRRADIMCFRTTHSVPRLRGVWSRGVRVA